MELWTAWITAAATAAACHLLVLAWAIPTGVWFAWRWSEYAATRITSHVLGEVL